MEIEIFTLCDFAQDNNSKLTIVGTFDSINGKQFPLQHPACAVACRLRFGAKETGDHSFRLRLIDAPGMCFDGTISANLIGGTGPFTYKWDLDCNGAPFITTSTFSYVFCSGNFLSCCNNF